MTLRRPARDSVLRSVLSFISLLATAAMAFADVQEIAPGKSLASAVVVDTGANGI